MSASLIHHIALWSCLLRLIVMSTYGTQRIATPTSTLALPHLAYSSASLHLLQRSPVCISSLILILKEKSCFHLEDNTHMEWQISLSIFDTILWFLMSFNIILPVSGEGIFRKMLWTVLWSWFLKCFHRFAPHKKKMTRNEAVMHYWSFFGSGWPC